MNINKAHICGRVTKDPEARKLPSGAVVVGFSIATNKVWKDKNGAKQEDVEFHNIVAFGKSAETIATYVKKGQLLYVEGSIKTRKWDDKDGKKNYRTEIVVDGFQFGPKATGAAAPSPASAPKEEDEKDPEGLDPIEFPEDEINPDDIPF